ncbi:MAG: DUF4910 domain-containing protein, partial [Anaerolineales bacterium]|nr:DUF4910 domain-containing protein [Anaerolineales bacterium]
MIDRILKLVAGELDGHKALAFTEQLTHFDRIPGTSGYHQAVECVVEMLKESGVTNIDRHRVKLADGSQYWHWKMDQRCYQDSARLELVEPWPELLLDTETTPICIARGSQPTPPAGQQAELVDVGAGDKPECYDNIDVAGKIVLAQGGPNEVATLAIHERSALGVLNAVLLLEAPPLRTRQKFPGQIQWQGLSTRNKSPETARGWGFAISHTLYLRLKELLGKGKVDVRGVVNGGWRDSHFDNIIAAIPGENTGGKQFWFVAHLCHPAPGAGDNASGCGAMIEIARTLTKLIAEKKVPRPKVDIKFLFCPEMIGSVAYVHDHYDSMSNAVGGICLDMVGQDQMKTGGALLITRAPNSLPSMISDLTVAFFEMQEQARQFWKIDGRGLFKFIDGPYVGLSDHYNFCDADVGVPMVSFIHTPDVFYHTNHDSIDKMSAYTFSVVGNAAASVALALSLPDEAGVRQMLELVAEAAGRRLFSVAEDGRRRAESAIEAGDDEHAAVVLAKTRSDLQQAANIEGRILSQALAKLPLSFDLSRTHSYLALLKEGLDRQAAAQIARLDFIGASLPSPVVEKPPSSGVPRRLVHGPMDYTDFFTTTTPGDFEAL